MGKMGVGDCRSNLPPTQYDVDLSAIPLNQHFGPAFMTNSMQLSNHHHGDQHTVQQAFVSYGPQGSL